MFIVIYFTLNMFCIAKANANLTTVLPYGHPLSLRNLCPHNRFCNSTPLIEIQDDSLEPCCEICSCEKDCYQIGSCCPDMPLSGLTEPQYPCRHLWHFGKDAEYYDFVSNYWYHVIDGCNDAAKALEYQRCEKPTDVLDYVMVVDSKGGKVYRNKHCADCHGIRNYKQLRLRVKCKDPFALANLATPVERDNFIMKNCSLSSFPPERRLGLFYCLPERGIKSTCNTSGTWDRYDKDIERGCNVESRDQNKIFTRYVYGAPTYFANVYCFLCNVDFNEIKADTCKKPENPDNKSGRISILFILNTNELSEGTALTKHCSYSQIWDPFTAICRQLFCPIGQIPVHGSCKELFSNIEGYTISIHFEVKFKNGNISDTSMLLRILINHFNRELGKDMTCGTCRSSLFYGKNSTSNIFFRHETFAKEGCQYSVLLEKARKVALKEKLYIKFRHIEQHIGIVLALTFEVIDHITGYSVLEERSHLFCSNVHNIDETIFSYCPNLQLTNAEAQKLGITNLHNKDLNSTVQNVCLDSYFLAQELISATAAKPCLTLHAVNLSIFMIFLCFQ